MYDYLQDIRYNLSTFADFHISHTYREGNTEANKLAKWAISFKDYGKIAFEYFRMLNSHLSQQGILLFINKCRVAKEFIDGIYVLRWIY